MAKDYNKQWERLVNDLRECQLEKKEKDYEKVLNSVKEVIGHLTQEEESKLRGLIEEEI